MNKKILLIGDLHLKDYLGYSEYLPDRREKEKKEILDFIINQANDCEVIVFLGDQLNSKINSSKVLKEFVNFIEKFKDKQLFFLCGNHEVFADGKTAIDFIYEIRNKKWEVIKNEIIKNKVGTFCPYFTKQALEIDTNEAGTEKLMEQLTGGEYLFVHHAISDTLTTSGQTTNIFNEIVLPKKELEKRYKYVIGGHIHSPQVSKNTIIAGSIFNNEMGEIDKYIWKIGDNVEKIMLPGRGIYKVENIDDLDKIASKNIVKVILTEKKSLVELKEKLSRFDAYLIVEKIPTIREIKYNENVLDLSIEKLLEIYSKERKIDYKLLLNGFELIK